MACSFAGLTDITTVARPDMSPLRRLGCPAWRKITKNPGTQATFTAQIRPFSALDDQSTVRTVYVRLRWLGACAEPRAERAIWPIAAPEERAVRQLGI